MNTDNNLDALGESSWSRRRFLAATASGVALVGLAACSTDRASTPDPAKPVDSDTSWSGELVDPPLERPDFTFTDVNGDPFPFLEKTEGKLSFLFFGYTNCPDVCPIFMTSIARAIETIGTGPGSDAQVIFVGVDIERDTPEQLKTFLEAINPDFIGLTGTEDVIVAANKAMFNPPIVIEEDPDGDGVYAVGNSSKVFAFTPDGLAHRIYPSDVRQKALVRDIPRLAAGQFK